MYPGNTFSGNKKDGRNDYTAIESCTLKFFMWTKKSGNECWVILSKLEDCSLINNITASSNGIQMKRLQLEIISSGLVL